MNASHGADITQSPIFSSVHHFSIIALDFLLRKIISAYLIGYVKITLDGRITKKVREYLLNFVDLRLFGLKLSSIAEDEAGLTMYVHTMNIKEELAIVKDATVNMFEHLWELISSPLYKEHLADFLNHANEIIASHHFYIISLLKAAADNPAVRSELKLKS